MKYVFLFCILMRLAAPVSAQDRTVVFAAASLSGALDEIAGEADVVFSYAGSGAIARQIAAGAPADVIVLANGEWMDWLVQGSFVQADMVHVIATNRLVVIGPAGSEPLDGAADLLRLLGSERLAMGQRNGVPAGSYARQWLQSEGAWDAVSKRLAETDNVRAALALVARGETPYGIVYASDALAEPKVSVVFDVPIESHDPVEYPAVALTPNGHAYLAEMRSDRGQSILSKRGFWGMP